MRGFARSVAITGGVVIVIGVLVLVGWAAGIASLRTLVPGRVAMNPLTAVAFILAGSSLLLLADEEAPAGRRGTGIALAAVVVAIAVARLLGRFLDAEVGVDQLFTRGVLNRPGLHPTNRMSPSTAQSLLLVGAALALLGGRTSAAVIVSQAAAMTAALIALLAVAGFGYSVLSPYGVRPYVPMALNTALSLAALCGGILCARPRRGVMGLVTGDATSGLSARRLLAATVLVAMGLGALALTGERAERLDPAFGTALVAISGVVVFTVLLLGTAPVPNAPDAARHDAEGEAEASHEMSGDGDDGAGAV